MAEACPAGAIGTNQIKRGRDGLSLPLLCIFTLGAAQQFLRRHAVQLRQCQQVGGTGVGGAGIT